MYIGHMTLKHKVKENMWGDVLAISDMLTINYQGLEIGVSNYFFHIESPLDQVKSISDIGFGMERVLWALHKKF